MKQSLFILGIIAAALVFPSVAANAVEDTTAPVLTDFTLTSSASIDTGPSSVSFAWTATATDDLSGVMGIFVTIRAAGGKFGQSDIRAASLGDLSLTDSDSATLPRYMPYLVYDIHVQLIDQIGNSVIYVANGSPDLCVVDTPCQITNAAP